MNFIQQYLDQGLFNIADNEERLLKLQASAETLSNELVENRPFVVQFLRATLVAKVDEEALVIARIEEHIKADWPTFRSAQPTRPVAIILAVGWQALRLAVQKDSDLSSLIWYISANLLAVDKIDSRLQIVIEFVLSQGKNLEHRATSVWSPIAAVVPTKVLAVALPETNLSLQAAILKASSSTNADGKPIEGGNPHAPTDAAWAAFFSKATATAIAAALTKLSKGTTEATQATFDDFSKVFTTLSEELVRSHAAQSRRTELLWLGQSLFSPRLHKGYRELSLHEAVLVLAVDMAEAAKGLSPQSVEYFLSETITLLFPDESVKLEVFVRDISQSAVRNAVPAGLFELGDLTCPIGLLEFIGALAKNRADTKQFATLTGLPKHKTMPLGDLARWIYREIKSTECIEEDLWT